MLPSQDRKKGFKTTHIRGYYILRMCLMHSANETFTYIKWQSGINFCYPRITFCGRIKFFVTCLAFQSACTEEAEGVRRRVGEDSGGENHVRSNGTYVIPPLR